MDTQETQVFIFLLIAIVVIATIITFFFISMVRQQKINLKLKQKNMVSELNSIEKERARIAADLHDELSPILSAIKLKVSTFELKEEEDRIQQQKTNEHLGDVLKRMREISFDLMPVTLQRKGLSAALQELVSYTSNKNQLRIELAAPPVVLSETFSIHLYRIVQEIIHNTIKHAEATLLQIQVVKEENKLVLTSKDNGKGFRYEERLEQGSGFGLRNLLSRTDVMGGELLIQSKEGQGTIYTIEIPLT